MSVQHSLISNSRKLPDFESVSRSQCVLWGGGGGGGSTRGLPLSRTCSLNLADHGNVSIWTPKTFLVGRLLKFQMTKRS